MVIDLSKVSTRYALTRPLLLGENGSNAGFFRHRILQYLHPHFAAHLAAKCGASKSPGFPLSAAQPTCRILRHVGLRFDNPLPNKLHKRCLSQAPARLGKGQTCLCRPSN